MSIKHRLGKLEDSRELQIQAHVETIKRLTYGYSDNTHKLAHSWHHQLRDTVADERPDLLAIFDSEETTDELSMFILSILRACANGHRAPLADTEAWHNYIAHQTQLRAKTSAIHADIPDDMFSEVRTRYQAWLESLGDNLP